MVNVKDLSDSLSASTSTNLRGIGPGAGQILTNEIKERFGALS
jgi:hypothetical protein